jgi:hypothetical protein
VKLFSDICPFLPFRRFLDACVQSPSSLEPFLGRQEPHETPYSREKRFGERQKGDFLANYYTSASD